MSIFLNSWSEDELRYLIQVYGTPNLCAFWNKHAKACGWPSRSKISLREKIQDLREKRMLPEKKKWVSQLQLATSLGVTEGVVARWRYECGLPFQRNSEKRDHRVPCKINISDFVRWSASEGKEELAKAVASDRLALTWFLAQVNEVINANQTLALAWLLTKEEINLSTNSNDME